MSNQPSVQPDPTEGAFNTAGTVIASGKAVQAIQTPYVTAVAVQKPRDMEEFKKRVVAEAKIAGEDFYFRWSTKNKDGKRGLVEGPSIDMAMSLLRNYGNCTLIQRPTRETLTAFYFCSVVIDLETGSNYERELMFDKREKMGMGGDDEYRIDRSRFQKGQSLCQRNAVLAFMPNTVIDAGMDAAKASARAKLEDRIQKAGGKIDVVIDELLVAFKKYGIKPDQIEQQHQLKRTDWTINTLTVMVADLKAIDRGEESADSLYGRGATKRQMAEDDDQPTDLEGKMAAAAKKANGENGHKPPDAPTGAPASEEAHPSAPPHSPEPNQPPVVDGAAERKAALIDEIQDFIKAKTLFLPAGTSTQYSRAACASMDIDMLDGLMVQLNIWAQPKAKQPKPATVGKQPPANRPF